MKGAAGSLTAQLQLLSTSKANKMHLQSCMIC